MKILLQNVHTKFYYSLLDIWTPTPIAAFNFRQSFRALEFVRDQKLSDVQLVVKFDDSQWDEVVPLPLMVATLSPRARA